MSVLRPKILKMKYVTILLVALFTGINLFAQSEKNEKPATAKTEPTIVSEKKQHKSIRAVQFKYTEIKDKNNPFFEVENVKYPWFSDREKAMGYFNKQSFKKDFTILYVDGKDPDPAKMDVVEFEE